MVKCKTCTSCFGQPRQCRKAIAWFPNTYKARHLASHKTPVRAVLLVNEYRVSSSSSHDSPMAPVGCRVIRRIEKIHFSIHVVTTVLHPPPGRRVCHEPETRTKSSVRCLQRTCFWDICNPSLLLLRIFIGTSLECTVPPAHSTILRCFSSLTLFALSVLPSLIQSLTRHISPHTRSSTPSSATLVIWRIYRN
jgi:hypothetical protein